MYRRILVALDGSGIGEMALPHAATLGHAFRSQLTLVRVVVGASVVPDMPGVQGAEGVPSPSSTDAAALSSEASEATGYLEMIATRLRSTGLEVQTRVMAGPVARAISDEAASLNADLLILAAHGRGGIARLVIGSVAEELVRIAPCPVFLIPATPQQRSSELPAVPSGQVRSFEFDARASGPVAPKPIGLRVIDVNRIVGSVGRARELGADFRPHGRARRRSDDQRFSDIVAALDQGLSLPPIDVYKLGYHYYVLDGNHRVAAAKARKQADIEAIVTEFLPVSDEESAQVFVERRHFERVTGLTRIGASRVGHYPRLEELIRAFADDQTEEEAGLGGMSGDPIQAAANRWYFDLYRPIEERIRVAKLSRCFPSERTADIFVHLANFRDEQSERLGTPITWTEAVERFVEHFAGCAGSAWQRIPGLRFLFRPRTSAQAITPGS